MANHRLGEGGRSLGEIQLDLANEDTTQAADFDPHLEAAFSQYDRFRAAAGALAVEATDEMIAVDADNRQSA